MIRVKFSFFHTVRKPSAFIHRLRFVMLRKLHHVWIFFRQTKQYFWILFCMLHLFTFLHKGSPIINVPSIVATSRIFPFHVGRITCTVWKNENSLSRNSCLKRVRVDFLIFHTVPTQLSVKLKNITEIKLYVYMCKTTCYARNLCIFQSKRAIFWIMLF